MSEKPKAPESTVNGASKPSTRTAVDRWNHAVREAYLETPETPGKSTRPPSPSSPPVPDASSVLEASDEEIERQLVAAGFDLAAEDAKALATFEAMKAKLAKEARARDESEPQNDVAWVASTDQPGVTHIHARRSRRAVWLAWAVAAAAATGGAAYVAGHQRPHDVEVPKNDLPVVPPPASAEPPIPTAAPPTPAPSSGTRRPREEKAPR